MFTQESYKTLKSQAHAVRQQAWNMAEAQLGVGALFKRVETLFGKPITHLRQDAKKARERYQRLLRLVLNLERELELADDEQSVDLIGFQLNLANCNMAAAEVELIKAETLLGEAEAVIGAAEENVQIRQQMLCAADPLCQAFDQVRAQRQQIQREASRQLLDMLGDHPVEEILMLAQEKSMGKDSGEVLDAIFLHKEWHRKAAVQAARIARMLNRFEGPYIEEAPPETEHFDSFGNIILAFTPQKRIAARWAVTADGTAYLLEVRFRQLEKQASR